MRLEGSFRFAKVDFVAVLPSVIPPLGGATVVAFAPGLLIVPETALEAPNGVQSSAYAAFETAFMGLWNSMILGEDPGERLSPLNSVLVTSSYGIQWSAKDWHC